MIDRRRGKERVRRGGGGGGGERERERWRERERRRERKWEGEKVGGRERKIEKVNGGRPEGS